MSKELNLAMVRAAHVVRAHPSKVAQLLQKHGVRIRTNAPVPQVEQAMLIAIKGSPHFRKDFAKFLTDEARQNAVGLALNVVDDPIIGGLGGATAGAKAGKSGKGGQFWDKNSGVILDTLNTGLNIWGQNMDRKAQAESEKRAIEIERIRLAQLVAGGKITQGEMNKQLTGAAGGGGGSSKTILIVLGVVTVGLLGYFAYQKFK